MNGARAQSTTTRGNKEPSLLEMANFYSERNRRIFYGDEPVSGTSGDARSDNGSLINRQKGKSLGNLVECSVNNELVARKPPHHLPSLSNEPHDIATTRGTRERVKREKSRPKSTAQKGQLYQKKEKIKKKAPAASLPPIRSSHHSDKDKIKDIEYADDRECIQVKKAASVPENTQRPLEQGNDSTHPLRPKNRGLLLQRLAHRCQGKPNKLEKVHRSYGDRATFLQEEVLPLESQVSVRRKGICLGSDDFLKERTKIRVVFKRLGEEGEFLPTS